jgi:hypothetical protein
MRNAKRFVTGWIVCGVLIVLVGLLSVSPTPVEAQSAGNNAVYTSASAIGPSASFIDASVLPSTTSTDICSRINSALGMIPSAIGSGVIDARGINSGNSSMTCAQSPWINLNPIPDSIILLPAGTITLASGSNWVLPNYTRLIGEGTGASGTSTTTIVAGSSFSGAMIQMGWNNTTPPPHYSANPCPGGNGICFGISVEDLSLNGSGIAGVGILNENSQEHSYVARVSMYQIPGTGLQIGGAGQDGNGCCQAQNSGPYSNILVAPGTAATSSTVCAQVLGEPDTRGIHGITCEANGTPEAAILLDSDNTTIEDAHLDGFHDGILVGSMASESNNVQSNVLFNITGSVDFGPMTNLIHISKASPGNTTDLTILGATSINDSNGNPTNTIQDDETGTAGTTLPYTTDPHVGMYVLGQPMSGSASSPEYSRFTTSPSVPTWGFGNLSSITITGKACTSLGALFSNTSGSNAGTNTLFACVPSSATVNSWQPIK